MKADLPNIQTLDLATVRAALKMCARGHALAATWSHKYGRSMLSFAF